MKRNSIRYITTAGVIAACYFVICIILRPFSFQAVQVRLAEALCILPYFTPAAVPGLAVGCLLANLIGGAMPGDIIFGSLATLIGAAGTYALRHHKYLASIPPIAANTIIIPFVLRIFCGEAMPVWLLMLSVGAGEVIACGIVGTLLLLLLERYRSVIFK